MRIVIWQSELDTGYRKSQAARSTVSVILLQCYRLTASTREYRKRAKKRDVCDTSVSRFTSTWVHGSERKGRGNERKRRTARDRERQERRHVRPTSVESDETLLDSAPGISRGNGGLILRRKFLTSRTFEPGKGEAFKVLSSRRFPDARGRHRERWRNIEENARSISTTSHSAGMTLNPV